MDSNQVQRLRQPLQDLSLDLPSVNTYQPETVDFPNSPKDVRYRLEEMDEPGTPDVTSHEDRGGVQVWDDDDQGIETIVPHGTMHWKKDMSAEEDGQSGSDLEDYFEDYHLPLTHQTVMSSRRSFRRKIEVVDIRDPDADRIEGIVKAGQLYRHGSIRRKIIPLPSDFSTILEKSGLSSDSSSNSLDTDHRGGVRLPSANKVSANNTMVTLVSFALPETRTTSTPKHGHTLESHNFDSANHSSFDSHMNLPDNYELCDSMGDIPPLEPATLQKIKECLDREKMKDLYSLGARLQDILTPAEIEEILSNSDRYTDVINNDVVTALSRSLQRHSTSNMSANDAEQSPPTLKKIPAPTVNLEASSSSFSSSSLSTTEVVINRPDLLQAPEERPKQLSNNPKKKRISALLQPSDDLEGSPSPDDPPTPIDHGQLPIGQSDKSEATESGDAERSQVEGYPQTPDELETPDELNEAVIERLPRPDLIPEISAEEERTEERNWRSVVVGGLQKKIDMKVIEPYKKVLSHGGYAGEDCQNAIILFSACFLPDRSRIDYDYVMDNLFLYVLTTLDQLVAEDYILVYLHGATPRGSLPMFGWLRRCYHMIDRRLRKNLKSLYLVHPTLWLKTLVLMIKPFISSKFSRKIKFVSGLSQLSEILPMDQVCVPDRVKQLEFTLMIQTMKRKKGVR